MRFSGAVKGALDPRRSATSSPTTRPRERIGATCSSASSKRSTYGPSSGRRPGAAGVATSGRSSCGAGLGAVGDRDRLDRAVAAGEQADQARVADQLGHVGGGRCVELGRRAGQSDATSSSSPVR